MIAGSLSISLLAASLEAVTSTSAPAKVFAIVVGNNHPLPGSGYAPLQFADDDAIRFAEFMESLGARVLLATSADHATAERYPQHANRAVAPTVRQIDAMLDEIETELAASKQHRREVFFYFSGHGSVSSSDAYLHLADGPFSRLDLREKILRRLPAERLHVIIDSCHSYFLVNARGERVRVAEEEETLERYPHAGFLLSTSARKEVHEWSGYQAGVFSYQILGALKGAADVDGDGIVSYGEVHAYVMAANLAVKSPAARVLPYVRRPVVRGQSVLDLRATPPERQVVVPASIVGHVYMTDELGARVLDANKPEGLSLRVVTPAGRDLFLHAGDKVFASTSSGEGLRVFDRRIDDAGSGERLASKGTVEDEFRKNLFSQPLTADFVSGLDAAVGAGLVPVIERRIRAPTWTEDPVTWTLLGSGALAGALGVVATTRFIHYEDRFEARPVTVEHERFRRDAETWRAVLVGGYAAGTALLAAGVVRAALTNGSADEKETFALLPSGAGLLAVGAF